MARSKKTEWIPVAGDYVKIKATHERKAFKGTIASIAENGYVNVFSAYNGGQYLVLSGEIVLIKAKRRAE